MPFAVALLFIAAPLAVKVHILIAVLKAKRYSYFNYLDGSVFSVPTRVER